MTKVEFGDEWAEVTDPADATIREQMKLTGAFTAAFVTARTALADPTPAHYEEVQQAEGHLIAAAVTDWSLVGVDGNPLPITADNILDLPPLTYRELSKACAGPITALRRDLNPDFGFVPKEMAGPANPTGTLNGSSSPSEDSATSELSTPLL
jgi:hypothetical protein